MSISTQVGRGEKDIKKISIINSAAVLSFICLMIGVAHGDSSIEIKGEAIQLKNFASSKKVFDRNHKPLWAVELDPEYMIAYDGEIEKPDAKPDVSNEHRNMAMTYGAATAYTTAIGGGISGSGLAHIGLNLLIGSEEVNIQKSFRNQKEGMSAGVIEVNKIFDVSTPEDAIKKGLEELSQYFSETCELIVSPRKPTYMEERYLFLWIDCKNQPASVILQASHVLFFPAFVKAEKRGFRVSLIISKNSWDNNPVFENRDALLAKVKEVVPTNWYILYADFSDKSYVVTKGGVEKKFPLPIIN